MLEAIPITCARRDFLPLMERVSGEKHKFMVTRQGKPVAVVLSYEEYSRMVDTISLTQDSRLTRRLKEGLEEIERGKLIPLTDAGDE